MSLGKTRSAELWSALSRHWSVAIPILMGVAAFFVVAGRRILSPRNIAWLASPRDDQTMYYLGWDFFRHSPWEFPLGLNPRYGAELSSSVEFVDNIPLLDFAFKAIGKWLSEPFQYFGLWILLCFVLQAWFAWLLVGLLTNKRFQQACGAALFLFAPPFLIRLSSHYQLFAQWLVLASLYVTFGPRRLARGVAWPLLALTSALVHSYLSAMVLALWAADFLRRALFERFRRADLVQLLVVPALVLLALWQTGLFVMGKGLTTDGFGYYRMNVLSLVDPSGWSSFLNDIPQGKGDYEGFVYLGLGGILLALVALRAIGRAIPALRTRREYWPLLAMLIALTLFAVSNHIGVGGWNFDIPLPRSVLDRAALLRTNGRMFWPVFYVLVWLALRAVVRHYPPRVASAVLFVIMVLQVVDTRPGWRELRPPLMVARGTTWPSPLHSRFWSLVPNQYREIRMVMPKNKTWNYATFAYFASSHGMATDAVAFARIDEGKLGRARQEAARVVNKGRYTPGVLYVLEPRFAQEAERTMNSNTDRMTQVDGFFVLAPGWRCRPECSTSRNRQDCSSTCPKP